MKHYFHPASRAATTHWMLTELDVPHEQVLLDFHAGETATAEFRALNPMGKIPTLEDDGVVVTEVAAICAYLADKFPAKALAPPPGSLKRGNYYRYMFFPGTTLEPMFTARVLGLSEESAESTGWGDYARCMTTVESMTPDQAWALGEHFSAADVVFGGMLDFCVQFGWIAEPSDKVAAYVQRLKSRPA